MGELPWFRIYTRSRSDAKLDALTDHEHRIWFNLLCLSAEHQPRGILDMLDPELVAIELRITADELTAAVARMARLKLVEHGDDGFLSFPKFEELQYDHPSDAPEKARDRKRLQRERERQQRDSHAMSRIGHEASRRELELETDTDKEKVLCEQPVDNSPETARADVRRRIADSLPAN